MGLRRVAHFVALLALTSGSFAFHEPLTAAETVSGSSRLATYETPAGDRYFALAVQPSADPALLAAVGSTPARVVVVVDTSASQAGDFRTAAWAAVERVLSRLRPEDRVQLFAADVRATPLSDRFAGGEAAATRAAVEKLQRRLPLGNTNLSAALHAARAELTGASSETRSILYIGDGSSLGEIRDPQRFAALVDALRADHIAVHSLAIGPTSDVALLATLANQTGGMVSVVDQAKLGSAADQAGPLAEAATLSPIWLDQLDLPEAMQAIQRDRLPPLRVDRDSVLIGRLEGEPSGEITLQGVAPQAEISVAVTAAPEASHPDFAFLPGLVKQATANSGLTLPTPGSDALRAAARALTRQADALADEGALALKQGNRRGAKAVADLALQADPKNPEALAVARLASDEEVLTRMLQEDVPAGGGNAPAAGGNPPAGDAAAGIGLEAPSGLLGRVQAERQRLSGQLRAEVNAALKQARAQLQRDPVGVTEELKILLATIESEPDVEPEVRQDLIRRVRAAIQAASAREAAYVEDQATLQQRQAAAEATERLLQETFRDEARLGQLSKQMNALMEEGRYDEAATDVAPEIVDLAGLDTVAGIQPKEYAELVSTVERQEHYRRMRERNFVDAFGLVEKAFVPFIDEPPIVYPDAETWQRLSRRRIERYGSLDLAGDNETERRIYTELDEETNIPGMFEETLQQAVRTIGEAHEIPMRIDARALEEIGLTTDTPVSIDIQGISLRSFLRLMLEDVDLTYMIQDEVLKITTREAAEANLVNKVYPVGDLVVPVINMGGGGMMGGMGGGMGGMGGGMGGMGGGMGGMGGGMGGMMGGGMGGMMMVPDDASLSTKQQTAVPKSQPASSPTTTPRGALRVTPADGQSQAAAWREHFRSQSFDSAAAQQRHDQRVRATVRMLNVKANAADGEGDQARSIAHFEEIRDLIAAALSTGQVQPWMYQAYALALMGSQGPQEEIERAWLSAVDFAETSAEVLQVARHLESIGSREAALRLCQDVARAEPFGREAYLIGLRLAEKLDDVDALRWACTGLLGQAWPEAQADFEADVRRLARATYRRLKEEGRYDEATAFEQELAAAVAHDVVVRVTWTGDADLDLAVEEPSGTVCSLQNTRSPGGGVLLGDAYAGESQPGNVSETYICPKGFSGTYRLLVRRVWGDVSTGHATVEILTDIGRPTQRLIQQQVALKEQDALVLFEVKEGRREEQIAAAQLQHLQQQKEKMGGAVLAQLAGGSDRDTAADYISDLRRFRRGTFGPGGFRGAGAVGFEPEITQLPEGASLTALGIISADRRYVRITPTPTFSQVGNVSTFNFVTGDSGTDTGGAGAGGGGIGGGIGGGGGFGGGGGGGGGIL